MGGVLGFDLLTSPRTPNPSYKSSGNIQTPDGLREGENLKIQ